MSGYEAAFIFGAILGFISGMWLGGRSVLWRMHRDDVENAHKTYKKRKDNYLSKKLK